MLRTLRSVILALLLPASALAAHPLVTDDTGTQGDRALQLELTAEALRDRPAPGDLDVAGTAAATLSLGVGEAVDLVIGLPAAWSRSRAGGAVVEAAGTADGALDVKWRFLEVGGFSAAVKPGLTLATGDPRRGLGAGAPGYGLSLIATQALGPLALHFNAGWRRQEHALSADAAPRHERWHVSAAATATVSRRLQVVANVGAESPGARGETTWPAYALAGAIWSVTGALDLDVGVRTALDRPDTDLALLAGAALRF